jgi:photosystem II stability/assembly factor-like uncharacterized protein
VCRRLLASLGSAWLGLASLAVAPAAHANGRFPAAGQIAVHPSDESRIAVRATYGILLTSAGGEPWSFLCEEAVGYGGYQDPPLAFTADGSLLAAVVDGLSVSHDGACTWQFPPGPAGSYVLDVSTERGAPERAVAVLTTAADGSDSVSQLWASDDDGRTWAQAGADMPSDFLALNVDVAPSSPQRVYASGRFGAPDYQGTLLRSDDRGETWQRFDIPSSDAERLPYLSAVDPVDPDLVYVRLDGDPIDALIVSRDGGLTWQTAFEGAAALLAFALSPDGSTVAIGGEKDGVWRAPSDTLQFEKRSDVGARCFLWTAAGLYACADEFRDQFTVGLSKDEGGTFQPLMHLNRLCGPLECPAGTPTGDECPAQWGKVKLTLQIEPCVAGGAEAGSSGAAGAGETPPGSASGCACASASPSDPRSAAAATVPWLAGVAVALRRARRRNARKVATRECPSQRLSRGERDETRRT